MGEPVGKASGRTFNQMSTHLPDTCWSSLSVTSSHTLNMSIQSPSAALKSGLPMSVFATVRYILIPKMRRGQQKFFFGRRWASGNNRLTGSPPSCILKRINTDIAENLAIWTWVNRSVELLGEIPVMTKMILCRVKASGRTFNARSTYVPAPCWSSLLVTSSHSLKCQFDRHLEH